MDTLFRQQIDDLRKSKDLREWIESDLGTPSDKTANTLVWSCPFHNERTVGAFHVYKERYNCFSCGANGDIFEWVMFRNQCNLPQAAEYVNGGKLPKAEDDPEWDKKVLENSKKAEESLREEIAKAQKALQDLQRARKWIEYHDRMPDQARCIWESRGIPCEWQDYFSLGYCPDKMIYYKNTEYRSPTLTIPVFEAVTRDAVNIRHRLLKPPTPGDKYRPEFAGLPAALYIASVDEPLSGRTLLVEGEIKAMVCMLTADDPGLCVVGLPGYRPCEDLIEKLKDCDPIYMCIDPDSYIKQRPNKPSPFERLVSLIGAERLRIINLHQKIDDLIIKYELDKFWIRSQMDQARKVRQAGGCHA